MTTPTQDHSPPPSSGKEGLDLSAGYAVVSFVSRDAPAKVSAIARIMYRAMQPERRAKGLLDFGPVVFHAETEEAARAKAHQWWADELARVAAVEARNAATSERAKARGSKTTAAEG